MEMRIAVWMVVGLVSAITGPSARAEEPASGWDDSFKTTRLADRFFAEGATYGDLNNDRVADLVAGPFWFAGPDFQQKQTIYPPAPFDPLRYSDNFFANVCDFNADGWNDVLVYGFPGKDASWYENPKQAADAWTRHIVLTRVDNESPTWGDLTGDGKPEIICSQNGFFGYASPNWSQPAEPWTFHKISDNSAGGQFAHGLGFGDVNGDGRADLLEKSGWWEQPAALDGDPQWKKHPVPFSGGGSQMYVYDVDGDGLHDVITGLAAHGYGLVWHRQLPGEGEPKFAVNKIMGDKPADNPYGVYFSQLHAIDLVDMNGDGLKDIVTGKRYWAHGPKGDPEPNAPAVLYWFELVRPEKNAGQNDKASGVEWIPHLIHDDSGVGVQVVAGDFSGDGRPDVVVANKKGIFAHVQQKPTPGVKRRTPPQAARRADVSAEGLDGEAAARAMTLPTGFSVKLCAAEPDVQQPIAMAFDDRGRLWVAEAYSYPVRVPEGEARDRLLIFEDTDGDSRFDQRKVFIDGLNLVSGLELGFGGVWVGAAPHLLFIPDANGDDVPDAKPTVLLDGWGYQDTHETLNSFIWGPDGWLYGCHGVFTHSAVGKPGTPDEQRQRINAGIWRYHPTRHTFEVFAEGTSNPWGVDFNDRGHAFLTACVIPHLYHVIQGARYQRQAGQHFNPYTFDDIKTIAKHRHWVGNQWNNDDRAKSSGIGGGHAHAGAMIYQGGSWPEQYRNQLFMNNIHGARLNQDQLSAAGSGYVGDAAPDFCFANDVWSQVIYLTYGPDGQVTMIDWYDRNQCHHRNNENHDRRNGRIFKIVYDNGPAVKVDLAKEPDLELAKLQFSANEWFVRHARRQLQERAAANTLTREVAEYLAGQLIERKPIAERLRAMWALHAVGALDTTQRLVLLGDTNADVRAWTIQLSAENGSPTNEIVARMEQLAASDPSLVVRSYLASAVQRLPLAERGKIVANLLAHAEDAGDHNLPLQYWYAAEPLTAHADQAITLLRGSKLPVVSRYIVRRLAAEERFYDALLGELARYDEPTQAWMLEEVVAALKARAKAAMPGVWQPIYEQLSRAKDESIRRNAEYVAVKFGDIRVLPALRKVLVDRSANAASRRMALESLLSGRDDQLPPLLHKLLDEPSLRIPAINALAAFDHADTPMALLDRYSTLDAAEKQAALATLTSRPQYVLALLDRIEVNTVPRNDLSAFAVRQLAMLNNPQVQKRVNEVWGTMRATSADKAAELKTYKQSLNPGALSKADLPHGRQVFAKTCGSCHVLFNTGKQIGPDLTGSNRANLDYVLENVLDPSAVIGKDYQTTLVITSDGRTITGIVRQETPTAVTLQTPTDVVTIAKSDIDERKLSQLSLMPDGQLKQLQPVEIRDLVAYLASPGQVPLPGEGPYFDPTSHKIQGVLEGEELKILSKTGGSPRPQAMKHFAAGRWSGHSHLWWTGAKPGDSLVLAVPVEKAGTYEISVVLTKAVDYGVVQLAWNNERPTQPIDLFNKAVTNTPPISLGSFSLAPGLQKLTIAVTGANEAAVKNYMFGLDYVRLSRLAK